MNKILFLLALALLVPSVYSAVNTISACSTINSSGYYLLDTDISPTSSGSCIEITSDDVIFDCDGYSVNAPGGDYAIAVRGQDNITVRNCVSSSTFSFYNVDSLTLEYNSFENEQNSVSLTEDGIMISSSRNVMIKDNSFDNASLVIDGDYIDILNNEFFNVNKDHANTNSFSTALEITYSDYVNVENNVFRDSNGGKFLSISDSSRVVVEKNSFRDLVWDVGYVGGFISIINANPLTFNENIISKGVANDGELIGLYLESITYFDITKNVFEDIDDIAITLYKTEDGVIVSNNISADFIPVYFGSNTGDTYVTNVTIYNNAIKSGTHIAFSRNGFGTDLGTSLKFDYGSVSCSSNSIVGGCLGGNYYELEDGYSKYLQDLTGDGIADIPLRSGNTTPYFEFGSVRDNYPLAPKNKPRPINKCIDFDQDYSGGTYVLDNDLSIGPGDIFGSYCIDILAKDFVLDCKNNKISLVPGLSEKVGIRIYKTNNVTIKNCIIEGFSNGTYISDSQDVELANVQVNDFDITGINIYTSSQNAVSNLRLNDVFVDGYDPATSYLGLSCLRVLSFSDQDLFSEIYIDGFECKNVDSSVSSNEYSLMHIENGEELYISNLNLEATTSGLVVKNVDTGSISDSSFEKASTGSNSSALLLILKDTPNLEVINNLFRVSGRFYGALGLFSQDVSIYDNEFYLDSAYVIVLGDSSTMAESNTITNNYFNYSGSNPFYLENVGFNVWNNVKTCGPSVMNILGYNCLGGNYYSSYSGADADQDGIGDTPFVILSNDNVDQYPLVFISSPLQNQTNQTNTTTNQTLQNTTNQTLQNNTNQTFQNTTNQTITNQTTTGQLTIGYNFACPEYLTVYVEKNGQRMKDVYVEVNDSLFGGLVTSGLTDSNGEIEFNFIPPIKLDAFAKYDITNETSGILVIDIGPCSSPLQNQTNQTNTTTNQTLQNNTNNPAQNNTVPSNNQTTNQNNTQQTASSTQKVDYSKVSSSGSTTTYKITKNNSPTVNSKIKVIYSDGSSEILETNEKGELLLSSNKEILDMELIDLPEEQLSINWMWVLAILVILAAIVYAYKKGMLMKK